MEFFIKWFAVGVLIGAAVYLVSIMLAICFCCFSDRSCIDILFPKAAPAPMVFDTVTGNEGADDGGCAICLSEYAAGERRATISECNHRFHALCIETWFQHKCTCPLCRHDLV
ncbi:putative RING-H2 finger protein ATL69 [Salvia miltiorrhiza]|uniref:putative RING-H2 finger protein ATL69 n=1 Tax=Salvia miltiorrhiza TaxID=226208 RepID=UPI0025AD91EE|nr:putative RING-H2 finger protein ATL69 [Salvia miltiorrhiza]